MFYQDEIVNAVRDAIEQCLINSSGARNIVVRSLSLKSPQENPQRNNPFPSPNTSTRPIFSPVNRNSDSSSNFTSARSLNSSQFVYRPERLVRTDARTQRLDAFLNISGSSSRLLIDIKSPITKDPSPDISASGSEDEESGIKLTPSNTTDVHRLNSGVDSNAPKGGEDLKMQKTPSHRRPVLLESVRTMREAVEARASADARNLLRECVFVGCVSRSNCLVQHTTNLLLLRLHPLAKELFYQLAVANFANHGEVRSFH